MQTKILAALTDAVTSANPALEAVDKRQWGNMGTLYVQPKDGFTTVLRIGYDFQDRTFKVTLLPESVDEDLVASMPSSMRFAPAGEMAGASCTTADRAADSFWAYTDYAAGTEIQDIVDFVSTIIRTRVPA